jgi:putative transposase
MPYDPARHHRRSIRLAQYDYSLAGAYFVTVCAHERNCLFGDVVDADMLLNDAGRLVQTAWDELPGRFPGVELDGFMIMPNHVHGIVILGGAAIVGTGPGAVGAGLALPWEPGAAIGAHSNQVAVGAGLALPWEPGAAIVGTGPGAVGAGLALPWEPGEAIGAHSNQGAASSAPTPATATLGDVIRAFKSISALYVNRQLMRSGSLWQRNYYERIIRDEAELQRIREYIETNPARWADDSENPNGKR